ncbi:DUF6625 family protein [Aromatoleum bremense]|uniref:DUF6625 family protein n=1 Tax=Aromatoleum bremense TaxID=76115 RepID=UPI001BB65919|nr:Uncharacterized protein pbN1_24430 [Aromatoleum bremense]
MQPRIRFIIPYFGRWPFWMGFFLRSCRSNPDIEWLFFTDCGVPADAPGNVEFRECSFNDYCRRVSARLDIDFQPSSPYKLCDLKPALGYIHADELTGVGYWGFGDIDLVYGELRRYLNAVNLTRFELLSTHANRVSGHLCLMRNSTRMREAFMAVLDWREKLQDPQHCVFDESAFSRLFIRHKNWPMSLRRLYDICNPWRRHSEFVEAFTTPNGRVPWVDGSHAFPTRWIWREGRLTNNRDGERGFPYFHFIGWKCDAWPAYSTEQLLPDPQLALQGAWSITSEGFREV